MKRITTKVGDLFMEAEDGREESDRIKLYDSYSRYLDYLPLESVSLLRSAIHNIYLHQSRNHSRQTNKCLPTGVSTIFQLYRN
mgnify:CR=1 FL=1